jgi:hypothetical protein
MIVPQQPFQCRRPAFRRRSFASTHPATTALPLTCPHFSPRAPHHFQRHPASVRSLLALASLLHIPVLCFQHLLSTLQKNDMHGSPAQFQYPRTSISNLEPPVFLFAHSSSLLRLFWAVVLFVFNIFYLHCKKTTCMVHQLNSNVLDPSTLEPRAFLFGLFCSLCTLLRIPALCFQHLLSTLQKDDTAWFANLNVNTAEVLAP